jgi:hypothetical protein
VPFLSGVEAGRREAEFRGRPMLVFCVLRGCSACAAVADAAFRDAEVADLASRFVPVLADADREEDFGIAHRVRTFPTILVLDPAGAEAGRVEGAADAARVADLLRKALKKPGLSRPTAAERDLGRASAALARARTAKDWRSLLAAASSIERIGHEGPELEGARAARREATAEAVVLLAAAKALIAKGMNGEARQALARIAREFEGVDEAVEAKNLLREMDGPKPGGGPPGGDGGSKVDPGFDERLRHAAGDLDPETSAERRQEPGPLTPAPGPKPK